MSSFQRNVIGFAILGLVVFQVFNTSTSASRSYIVFDVVKNLTPKTTELAYAVLQISKFSWGSMPPNPPKSALLY